MKNHFEKIINSIFHREKIDKYSILELIEKRNFLDKKNGIFSLLPYSNKKVSSSIKDLKFKNNSKNGEIFGEILYDFLPEHLEDLKNFENFNNPILITIPLSFFRKIKRGYNQNNLIISSFMKNGGKNFIEWEKNNLIKIKNRKPQSLTKNRTERLENQKNAYKILFPGKIKNKNIIIFDDIYTTGATILEIKKILKKAGAKKIKVVVLAH